MTDRKAFTEEDWTLLRVTPSFVSVGIIAADATGLFSSIREAVAGAREAMEALNAHRELELFSALLADSSYPDLPDMEVLLGQGTNDRKMQNFKTAALDHVHAAVALLERKASAQELDAYRHLLVGVAERAADAAKEGGFLGFGGVRISERERAFIEAVRNVAGMD